MADDVNDLIVIGAGPAGLAAGYEAARRGLRPLVIEQESDVGGLCRTYERNGFRFDVGGHRFFTKNAEVWSLWKDLLGEELIERPRLSRIYYNGSFFHYPLQIGNAVRGLGLKTSLAVLASYLGVRLRPRGESENFEQWVSQRFGPHLYSIFFKTYTEKVWGIPCSQLGADWAAQRISNLSLVRAVVDALPGIRRAHAKTLIRSFHYPRYGPGQASHAFRTYIEENGGTVRTNAKVVGLKHASGVVTSVAVQDQSGETIEIQARQIVSTMPISLLVSSLDPQPDLDVCNAAGTLRFRSFISVNLQVDSPSPFPDKWIYIHSASERVGRIQSYGNWSPDMVPTSDHSGIGAEYFCFKNDDLWSSSDQELIALATGELEDLGLVDGSKVGDGFVVRVHYAYPMYENDYQKNVLAIQSFLDELENLETAGRAGMFRYNNMDHSILTGLAAVRRLAGEDVNIWDINADDDYLEG